MRPFTTEKIAKQLPELRDAIARETHDIPVFKIHVGDCPGAERPDLDDRDWDDFRVGDFWGGYDVVAWFRARVPIPEHLRGQTLVLRLEVGPRDGGDSTAESLLYVNGKPLQGVDAGRTEAWLPPECVQSGEIALALKAWSGVLGVPDRRRFKRAQLVWVDEPTERFYHLSDTLLKAVRVLPEDDLRRVRMLQALDSAFHELDWGRPGSPAFYGSVECAEARLRRDVCRLHAIPELKPQVVGVGHAHIDMAWLWRLSHTREKAARTFSTALNLMRQYPEYRFMHSSPQLYKFLKEDYPEIFEGVRARVASGEWEITGATWIEPDTNLPSGESLIRQILFGKRFMRDEFGVDTTVLWLPDVFGYTWSLPQLLRRSGIRYFLTSKISWNQFNRFPHDTFLWRGIDGSEVLTHFVTTPEAPDSGTWRHTYNGAVEPYAVKGLWDNYRQKDVNDELLLLYGWGDGGGGPTKEMLEAARAMRNLPGLPRVEPGTAEGYFARLEGRLAGKSLPVWDGELYLEYHRGTYTSQAYNKRANRKAEVLYHDAEWLSALADALIGEPAYPAEALRDGWEQILLNQFHDILPGSSIRQVYEDSREDYEVIERIGTDVLDRAAASLLDRMSLARDSLVVFNSLPWARDELIELPWPEALEGRTILGDVGEPLPAQPAGESGVRRLLVEVTDVPPLGYRAFTLGQGDWNGAHPAESEMTVTPSRLENLYYRVAFNARGQITSLFDKSNGREVLAAHSRGNVLQAFEDKPMDFDAWDIDIYYQEKMREVRELVEAEVEETGPLRGVLRLRWRFGDSTITQRICLYRRSPRIDFKTELDWHERQVLLKVAFPVAVRSTRATYDIQFGNIERPTHWNTSWDLARFESVGHKWVDLSEGNYGVALLNDCKYGHDVKDNVLRLTLIKSAVRPDAQADQGRHVFTYSLLPHAGGWQEAHVVEAAYALNFPPHARLAPAQPDGTLPDRHQFAAVEPDHVILETVKRAEDGGAWIVRLYEYKQCRSSSVAVRFGQAIRRAVECNLMEVEEAEAAHRGEELRFGIAPYEIKTFKIWF